MKVVIIEDDPDVALTEQAILQPVVAEIVVIVDELARVFEPGTWTAVDVAVIDLMLPGYHGEDICRYLIANFPQIRRVICTAKPTYELPLLRDLAHVVLQKPFDLDDLIHAVIGPDGP